MEDVEDFAVEDARRKLENLLQGGKLTVKQLQWLREISRDIPQLDGIVMRQCQSIAETYPEEVEEYCGKAHERNMKQF